MSRTRTTPLALLALGLLCALVGGNAPGCADAAREPGNAGNAPGTTRAPRSASEGEPELCAEHGVPEALCTQCNPALAAVFQARGDWCAEHGFPESFCPECHPGAAFPEVRGPAPADTNAEIVFEDRTVRFRSPSFEAAAGLTTVPVERARESSAVRCSAHVEFDRDHTADVRALVPGVVRRVLVDLGAHVTVGTPLVELTSVHVSESQAGLLTARERVRVALADVERKRGLVEIHVSAQRELDVAERELSAARGELSAVTGVLRLSGAGVASAGRAAGRYTLRSPIDGVVVRRGALPGLLASEDTSLAMVSDTSTVWVMCDVAERDAAMLQVGLTLSVQVHGRDAPVEGPITWISSEVDPRARTVTVRAAVPNADGALRANQFARGVVEVTAPQDVFRVPRSAVQRVGERELVFVRAELGVYEPRGVRRVQSGADPSEARADWVSLEGDLQVGDLVVTTGSFLLRTEILPGAIGAGCCEVSPGSAE